VAAPQTAGVDFVALAAKKAAEAQAQAAADAAAAKAAQVEADRLAAHKAAEAVKIADTGFGDVTAAVTKPVEKAPDAGLGFGDVSGTVPEKPAEVQTVAQNTVEDTGAPEDSDDDLDARIAGILPK
jgi:hypothetical protein